MKQIKTIFSSLALIVLLGIFICQNVTGQENELTKLVVALPFSNVSEEDIRLIEKEINTITEKQIGVTVDFPILESYYDDVTLMLSTNKQVDIMLCGYGSFMECYVDGYLYPLDNLLKQYGRNIISQVGMEKIQSCRINNTLYGLPCNGRYVLSNNVFYLNESVLEQEGADISDIRTMDDLEILFERVKNNYPDMTVVATAPMETLLSRLYFLNTSKGIPVMALMENGKGNDLKEIFTSKEYMDELKRSRKWYLKGYYNENIFGGAENVYTQISKGKVFAFSNGYSSLKQLGMTELRLDESIMNYYGYSAKPYCILNNSASPQKAMMLLDLFYSNKKIADCLCYGIENVHYKKLPDGTLTYANSKKQNNFLQTREMMPNPHIACTWYGDEKDHWNQIKKRNEDAIQSNMMGFNFDYSKVDTEYREVIDIYNNYKWILENGLVNPETGLKQMLSDMEAAGLNLITAEEKKQYDDWRKNNNTEVIQ